MAAPKTAPKPAPKPAAKASSGYVGDVICKGVDGSGNEITRTYHLDTEKTEDELFALFTEHFAPGTHGDVDRDSFKVETP